MSTRLYVGNLSFNTTTETVRQEFESIGTVTDVHVVMDRDTGRSKGFGFVTYTTDEAAAKCKSEMDGQMIDGRAVKVDYPREREERGGSGGYDRGPRRY